MKQILPSPLHLNNPALLRYSVLFILFIVSAAIQAQVPTHHLTAANAQTTDVAAGASGIGEIIWVLITLVFSYALNYYIRKDEKKPEKASYKELIPVVEQKEKVSQAEKPTMTDTNVVSNGIAKSNKGHYKRRHLLQPLDALHMITSARNKQRVAS
jgi:hypothetical protein